MNTLTQQQKLEILCAYLPYGVECLIDGAIEARMHSVYYDGTCSFHNLVESEHGFESSQLILRHPDDMTEDELYELSKLMNVLNPKYSERWLEDKTCEVTMAESITCIRYLHSLHIDTFGAIEAGFAVRKNINEKGE